MIISFDHTCLHRTFSPQSLGTITAPQVVVLNEDSVVVAQGKLM